MEVGVIIKETGKFSGTPKNWSMEIGVSANNWVNWLRLEVVIGAIDKSGLLFGVAASFLNLFCCAGEVDDITSSIELAEYAWTEWTVEIFVIPIGKISIVSCIFEYASTELAHVLSEVYVVCEDLSFVLFWRDVRWGSISPCNCILNEWQHFLRRCTFNQLFFKNHLDCPLEGNWIHLNPKVNPIGKN